MTKPDRNFAIKPSVPEIAEMMNNQQEESGYMRQRRVFKWALKAGWTGKEPSVLGTHQADVAYAEVQQFLTAKYAGNCAECGNRFYMADDIVVVTDSTGQHAYHANCADLLGIETTKAVRP